MQGAPASATFLSIDLYFSIILSLYFDHLSSTSGFSLIYSLSFLNALLRVERCAGNSRETCLREWGKMNGFEWLAQLVLTGVFLFDGFSRILSYRQPAQPQPARPGVGSIRLPYELAVAIGIAEIVGALALWVPASLWPPDILPRVAASALALLAVAGSIYHMRRKEPSAHNLAVFLLAVFVMLGRWQW